MIFSVSKKSDTSISIKLKPPKEPKEEKKPKIEPIKDVTTVTIKTDEKKPYLVTNSTGDTVVSYFDDDTVSFQSVEYSLVLNLSPLRYGSVRNVVKKMMAVK